MSQLNQSAIKPAQPGQIQGGLQAFIQRYDILLFFLLTFLFSWSIWFLSPYLPNTHDWKRLQGIASAGPVIAAMLLSVPIVNLLTFGVVSRWIGTRGALVYLALCVVSSAILGEVTGLAWQLIT